MPERGRCGHQQVQALLGDVEPGARHVLLVNASGCCRVAGTRQILFVPERISEKWFQWLLAFCSPSKLHIVLTCLCHQVPTLTSLERIPASISTHSASVSEHPSFETKRCSPFRMPLLPLSQSRGGRMVPAAELLGISHPWCRSQPKAAGRRPGWP